MWHFYIGGTQYIIIAGYGGGGTEWHYFLDYSKEVLFGQAMALLFQHHTVKCLVLFSIWYEYLYTI